MKKLMISICLLFTLFLSFSPACSEAISYTYLSTYVSDKCDAYVAFADKQVSDRKLFIAYATSPDNFDELNRVMGYTYTNSDNIEFLGWSYAKDDLLFASIFGAVCDDAIAKGNAFDKEKAQTDIIASLIYGYSLKWSKQYLLGDYYLESLSSKDAPNSVWIFVQKDSTLQDKGEALSQVPVEEYPDAEALEFLKTIVLAGGSK